MTKTPEAAREAVAWSYELATRRSSTGEYLGWEPRLSSTRPCVPLGSIRNLVALGPISASPAATSAENLEAVREIECPATELGIITPAATEMPAASNPQSACAGEEAGQTAGEAHRAPAVASPAATSAETQGGDGAREAELVRAASALLNNLWQDVWSHERTHEENWKEFDRKYPGVRWLRDARDAAPAPSTSAATPWEGSLAQRNLTEGWAAMRMIREAVETLGPIGAMSAEEHLVGPTFLHEADAIVAGIVAMRGEPVGWCVDTPSFGTAFFHDEAEARAQAAEPNCEGSVVSRVCRCFTTLQTPSDQA